MKVFTSKPPRFLLYSACLLFSLAFIACEPDYGNLLTSQADLTPSIFAFLNTAADSQYVILRNATPAAGSYRDFLEKEYQLYRRAKVRLTGKAGDLVLHGQYEIRSAFHEDYEHDFVFVSADRVRPGESYSLQVEIPQKGVYTASTTAPGDFQILSHHAQDTLDIFNPLLVRWTASEGAAGYRVGLRWTVLDSSRLKFGTSTKVDTGYGRQYLYVEPSAERVALLNLDYLALYYKSPGAFPRQTLGNDATILVEALDAPAWLARDLNQRGAIYYGGPDEARAMPGSYSNIANGRGLMSAVTMRTIPVILPPRKK